MNTVVTMGERSKVEQVIDLIRDLDPKQVQLVRSEIDKVSQREAISLDSDEYQFLQALFTS